MLSFVSVLAVWFSLAGWAAEPDRHQMHYKAVVGLRSNPDGAGIDGRIGYRYRLFNSDSMLLEDCFIGVYATPTITPDRAGGGGRVWFKPIAMFEAWVQADKMRWFGTFGSIQSFPNSSAETTVANMEAGDDAGLNYPANGTMLDIGYALQAKVGKIAIRSEMDHIYTDLDLENGDKTYYDNRHDLLMPNRGWIGKNDTYVLYVSEKSWILGANSSVLKVNFNPDCYGFDRSIVTWRTGPMVALGLKTKNERFWKKPAVLGFVNFWAVHPYRAGQEVPVMQPYFAVALKFEGLPFSG